MATHFPACVCIAVPSPTATHHRDAYSGYVPAMSHTGRLVPDTITISTGPVLTDTQRQDTGNGNLQRRQFYELTAFCLSI